MRKRDIKQKGIYICDLSPDAIDSETKDPHTVVVVSVDIRNSKSPNVYIFPITHSTTKKMQPTHWKLYKSKYDFFLYNINTVMCEEGRSVSKRRLHRYLGEIDENDFENILKRKEYIFIEKD